MNFKAIFLIAILAFSSMGACNAANTIHVDLSYNGWAKSSIEVYDTTNDNIYYEKQHTGACRKHDTFDFTIPDTCKWHDIMVKFNHGVAGQGPSDYVTIPAFTDGTANLEFETYGDDVLASYKGQSNHWNDKHRNIFYLGQP
ncbi:MAG: hypothetical protein CfClM3_0435 [Methanobrevibacter sp. CfCl-M3]